MKNTNSEKAFDAAVKLGFFTQPQLKTIDLECQQLDSPALQVAVKNRFLDGQQLEILKSFAAPEDVAPGYRIDGLLGQGGAGVVYKATQLRLNRTVAIKTICQSQLSRNELAEKRFEREAQIVGQLRHPNIVSAVDFGIHKQKLFLVMEFVDGIDAEKYLSKVATLPERYVWHIGLQVCHALNYSNQNGVIHRDIKPGNLIFTSPPNSSQLPPKVPFVKIADFGLARLQDSPTAPNITMENALGGTPFYMSAEQISSGKVDHQSDIYSLGITLWHLITGATPFSGKGPLDVIATKMKQEDQWLNEVPEGMSQASFDLLAQMCRHNSSDRISDYPKLISEIQEVIRCSEQQSYSEAEDFVLADEHSFSDDEVFKTTPQVTLVGKLDDFELLDDTLGKPGTRPEFDTQTKDFPASHITDQKPAGQSWVKHLVFAALATAAIGITSAVYLGALERPSAQSVEQGLANMNSKSELLDKFRMEEFEGPPYFLFNGQSFDPSQKFSGKWDVTKGEEGESVLAGNGGFRNFKCVDSNNQPLTHFAFTCGFRHHEADQLEYHLLDAEEESEFKVSISPTDCALFVGQTKVNTGKLTVFDAETFGYHVIQIESQADYWLVAIDSQVLGRVAKPKNWTEDSTIQLVVNGQGWAHFEQIRLRRFADAKVVGSDTN